MDTKKLRQKILDLAIHGKLVPQDPNDEPASVLLERIHAEKEALIKEGKIKRTKKTIASDTSHYENVPFEVPEGWCWCRLDEVADVARGGSPRPIKQYLTDSPDGVNWIKIGDTTEGSKYIEKTVEKIIPEGVRHSRMVKEGDFLLTNSMSFGKPFILKTNGCIHDGWLVISPFEGSFDKDYLYYLLSSGFAYDQFSDKASGAVVSNLNKDKVAESLFPLPPFEEQKKIVCQIESIMNFIDRMENNLEDVSTLVDRCKSRILNLAIHGKLVQQDANDEPASELLKRINPKAIASCDNPHYENIPSTWVCTTLGSIFQHNTGKALNKSTSVEGVLLPYLTTSNVYWGSFDLSVIKEMRFKDSEIEKCTVRKGDLLVCEGGDIGRAAIWDKDYTICIQNHLHRMRPKGDVIPLLYLYYIMHLKLTNNIEGKGIGLQGLSSGMLDKMEVPLPPYNEQKRIVDKLQEAFYILEYVAESLS